MIRNYLLSAFRSIGRFKILSFIKIFGLSLGIAACILIYLFVVDELSFDGFHQNGDRLFRVVQLSYNKDTKQETGIQPFIPPAVGPEMDSFVPAIEHQTRITSGSGVVSYGEKIFSERLTLADSDFFIMFSFPLIEGNRRTVLTDEHSVIFTRSMARKYFGEKPVLGTVVRLSFGDKQKDFIVTGIADDIPSNSTIQFDCIIHFNNLPDFINDPDILENWNRWYCPLYVQLQQNVSIRQAEIEMDHFCTQYFSGKRQEHIDSGYDPFTFGLQRVKNMRLDGRIAGNPGLLPSYLLSAIALVILLTACFNFMNLSVGMSSSRTREVGMRKILGAGRKQILRQFVGEGLLLSFLSVGFGLIFAELLLRNFNILAGKELSIGTVFSGYHFAALLVIGTGAGFAAGGYPAVVLSSLQPNDIMRGRLKFGGRSILTNTLVVLQFSLSIFLGLSAGILARQVSFMVNKDPGYKSEGLIVVWTQETEAESSERLMQLFKNELVSQSPIKNISASNREFGLFLPGNTLETDNKSIHYRFNRVDPDFLETLQIPILQGRDFAETPGMDRDAVIVNQKFMAELGPDYRVGELLSDNSRRFPHNRRIIGVVEDCHFESLRSEIEPMLLFVGEVQVPRRNVFSRIFVRAESGQSKEALALLRAAWKKVQPDKPFIHYYQEDALKSLYDNERRWSAIVRYASLFSILLACLGIFGLTALKLSRREKEIGIRKVLGARLEQILILSLREFLFLIAVANVVAWPVVYMVVRKILQNFAYRIPIGLYSFILAGAASFLAAILTVLYLSLKAALKNPIESLRYE